MVNTQYSQVLDLLRLHVIRLFQSHNDLRLVYHNLSHTEQVVENAQRIVAHYNLDDKDRFIVLSACWFHDLGYLFNRKDHEASGAEMARDFLTANQVDTDTVAQVQGCIMATKMPQEPQNLLQEIVCDADLFHLGGPDFKVRNKLMRKEAEACSGSRIDRAEWKNKTISLFKAHTYHTEFCRKLLNEGKRANLAELENGAVKAGGDLSQLLPWNAEDNSSKGDKKNKSDKPERGIETMFRITSANHQRLSDMADNKAHIMISTNSIILSVILSLLLRKLEDNPHLIIPTLLLLIICVVTMVFSILATRPSIPEGVFTNEDIRAKRVNLLFFGNFYRMSLPDYEEGMIKMMGDRDFLYGSLIRDVYAQGVVLGRKYRLLRVAYNVFMFGIVAAVLAFITAAYLVAI
ncbi:Pycsar system effector family protein [Pedobacter deserti]|uniref:Pycsar system effector family protein n=1 Tax=Pedobacter deserti TaxID=2817382 RepID=UPI00210CE24A|nr:Pycsar system effector family protein [Pedobacter sp. SYSU D00382]